jgi:hypothetical protein
VTPIDDSRFSTDEKKREGRDHEPQRDLETTADDTDERGKSEPPQANGYEEFLVTTDEKGSSYTDPRIEESILGCHVGLSTGSDDPFRNWQVRSAIPIIRAPAVIDVPPCARRVIEPVLSVRVVRGSRSNTFAYPTNLTVVDGPDGGFKDPVMRPKRIRPLRSVRPGMYWSRNCKHAYK